MLIDHIVDIVYAMGPPPEGSAEGWEGLLGSLLPLFLIFAIFYFLLIRPQIKRSREHKKMVENLRKGDKVITSGGIYGVIESVGPNTVTLKVSENVKVKVGKVYIAALRSHADED